MNMIPPKQKIKRSLKQVLLIGLLIGFTACSYQQTSVDHSLKEGKKDVMEPVSVTAQSPYTARTKIRDVARDPVFNGKGNLLFPNYGSIPSSAVLEDMADYLPWYSEIRTASTVEVLNRLYQDASKGKQVIYPLYEDTEIRKDPEKAQTAIIFFRGRNGARTAVVNAGGGFMYVGAIHDSFPHALVLSEKGYNVFCLIYRPDADLACRDLSHALVFLHEHQKELGIDMKDYSLWGGSAGARMADWVGTYGTEAFGEKKVPRPAAVIMAYTGLSEVTGKEKPTYSVVGTLDGIASARGMQRRTEKLRAAGIDAQIEVFPGLSHGFGVGTGTVAEGWVLRAAEFWEKHMQKQPGKQGLKIDGVND
jgi:acetyl esterase/lipase